MIGAFTGKEGRDNAARIQSLSQRGIALGEQAIKTCHGICTDKDWQTWYVRIGENFIGQKIVFPSQEKVFIFHEPETQTGKSLPLQTQAARSKRKVSFWHDLREGQRSLSYQEHEGWPRHLSIPKEAYLSMSPQSVFVSQEIQLGELEIRLSGRYQDVTNLPEKNQLPGDHLDRITFYAGLEESGPAKGKWTDFSITELGKKPVTKRQKREGGWEISAQLSGKNTANIRLSRGDQRIDTALPVDLRGFTDQFLGRLESFLDRLEPIIQKGSGKKISQQEPNRLTP
jgi:hypothetical protein